MLEAVFLDRDGTINVERSDYVKTIDEFVLLPGALNALGSLATLAIPIIIVTDQAVIGRGLASATAIGAIHAHLKAVVLSIGGRLDAIYVCPHHPDEHCICRKPKPGMLHRAAADYGLNLANCVFIGDSLTDLGAARAGGCMPLMVSTGRQAQQLTELAKADPSVIVMDSLLAAVSWLRMERPPDWPAQITTASTSSSLEQI